MPDHTAPHTAAALAELMAQQERTRTDTGSTAETDAERYRLNTHAEGVRALRLVKAMVEERVLERLAELTAAHEDVQMRRSILSDEYDRIYQAMELAIQQRDAMAQVVEATRHVLDAPSWSEGYFNHWGGHDLEDAMAAYDAARQAGEEGPGT